MAMIIVDHLVGSPQLGLADWETPGQLVFEGLAFHFNLISWVGTPSPTASTQVSQPFFLQDLYKPVSLVQTTGKSKVFHPLRIGTDMNQHR